MSNIEVENLDSKNECIRILTESNNLKAKVEELTKSENQARKDLRQIQQEIYDKEEEIERM
jgi:hypothetical protein